MTRVKGNQYAFRYGSSLKLSLLPSEKGLLLKERVDSFPEGDWCVIKLTGSHKSCLPCVKMLKYQPSLSIHLKVPVF